MNVLDAFYHTVHDSPGGSEALAPRMGMTPAILNNKADTKKEHNKPLLVDADKIMDLTGDFRILQSLAHKHGFLLVKAPDGAEECDMSVLESVTGSVMLHGGFIGSIHESLVDNDLTQDEIRKIEKAAKKAMTAIVNLLNRLRGMAG